MVKYEEAIKKPFTDFKKLLIGIVLSLIPVVNSTVVTGYAIESSGLGKTKKAKAMPEWEDWTRLFMQGLTAAVISIIYMIPSFAIMMLGVGLVVSDLAGAVLSTFVASDLIDISSLLGGLTATGSESQTMASGMMRGYWYAMLPTIVKAVPLFIVAALLALIASFVSPIAVLNYVNKKRFGAAFDFAIIFKKALTAKYAITWVAVIVLATVIGMAFSFVPWFGGAIALFVIGVMSYSLYGDAYREA